MNRVSIGDMRQRLVLEQPDFISDGGGGVEETWLVVAELWAAMKPLTGAERVEAEAVAGRVSHEVWLRYRDGVTSEMRFRLGNRFLDIRAVIDVDEKGRFLKCLAEERDL
ncbi:MAG: phage head closure protein [Hyphomicrobiaceae bacterium]